MNVQRREQRRNSGRRRCLFSMLRYDLYQGLFCKWKRLVLALVFCVGAGVYLRLQFGGISAYYAVPSGATFMDYLLHMLHGMEKFVAARNQRFELPITYLAVFAVTSFMAGGYLREDMRGSGMKIIVQSRDRKKWVLSKILWNMSVVTAFYIIMIFTAFLMGGGGLEPTAALCRTVMRFPNVAESGLTQGGLLALTLGMAYLSSLAAAQVQMALEMIFSPMTAFIGVMTVVFLSAYITSPFLPGNYFMIQRNTVFLTDGITTMQGLLGNLVLIAGACALDFYCFIKRDIL